MADEFTHSTIQQHIVVDIKKYVCLKRNFPKFQYKCNVGACSVLYSALWRVSVFDRAGADADFDSRRT